MLNNLIGNAIKFTEKGSITLDLSVTKQTMSNATLRFSISDTGVGIREQDQKMLFQRFQQIDASSTRQQTGSGLGLSICKQLVELMGGHLGFNSIYGVGSTFWFELPAELTQRERLSHQKGSLAGLNVLVHAETPGYQRYFADVLKNWNIHHVITESTASFSDVLAENRNEKSCVLIMEIDFFLELDVDALLAQFDFDIRFVLIASQNQLDHEPKKAKQYNCILLAKPLVQSEVFNALQGLRNEIPAEILQEQIGSPVNGEFNEVRVLLVEDNAINVVVAKGLIQMFGPTVEVAENGQEALDMLTKQRFDLVFMDCQMPVMDGYECTRHIRDPQSSVLNHKIPVVALTANAMRGDKEACLAAGMDDYIAKPVEADMIQLTLKKWLSGDALQSDGNSDEKDTEMPEVLPVFDKTTFGNRLMEDGALMKQVALNFIADMPVQLDKLGALIESEDFVQLAAQAHKIKGAAANMAANQMHALAIDFEQAAKGKDKEHLVTIEPMLMQAFSQLKQRLEQELI